MLGLYNLARYIIRASFSQERLTYLWEAGQVEYKSKGGKETRVFDAMKWLGAMCSYVPNKGEQIHNILGPKLSPKELCKNCT